VKEKIPTYVYIEAPHDWWTRFNDALPYLIGILLLVALGLWYFKKYRKWIETVLVRMEERVQEMESRLKRVEEKVEVLRDYPEWQRFVESLHTDFQKIKEKVYRKDPLEAIVKEQRQIGR